MKKLTPKQKIWLRVAIYVPLLAYFGYGAFRAYQARSAADAQMRNRVEGPIEAPELEGVKREYTLPNGQTITVTEMTEEQARAQGYMVPTGPNEPAAAAAGTDSENDAENDGDADTKTGTGTGTGG